MTINYLMNQRLFFNPAKLFYVDCSIQYTSNRFNSLINLNTHSIVTKITRIGIDF